jgi:tetratricopeptide (TPR) repeat protein
MRQRAAALLLALTLAAPAAASPSSDELVRQARAHEASDENDLALRRYNEALTLDAASGAAWLGLAHLREKVGERQEAERVYSAALERLPSLQAALKGRAEVRWALGRHDEARADLQAYVDLSGDIDGIRRLAQWFEADGLLCAELAAWRRLLAVVPDEARPMVRALVLVVDGTDPASSPVEPDATRSELARIARQAPAGWLATENATSPKPPAAQTTPRASSQHKPATRASASP